MEIQLVFEGLEFREAPIAMADGSMIMTEVKAQRLMAASCPCLKSFRSRSISDTGQPPFIGG